MILESGSNDIYGLGKAVVIYFGHFEGIFLLFGDFFGCFRNFCVLKDQLTFEEGMLVFMTVRSSEIQDARRKLWGSG